MPKRYLSPEEKRAQCVKRLAPAVEVGITTFLFHASKMLAGPCPRAAELDQCVLALRELKPVPFEGCSHPDQCGCLYQAWFDLMDEQRDD